VVRVNDSRKGHVSQASASVLGDVARGLLNISPMKHKATKTNRESTPTLAELISTVNQLTHDEQLGAYIVADLINSRKVRLEGEFHGRKVVVS